MQHIILIFVRKDFEKQKKQIVKWENELNNENISLKKIEKIWNDIDKTIERSSGKKEAEKGLDKTEIGISLVIGIPSAIILLLHIFSIIPGLDLVDKVLTQSPDYSATIKSKDLLSFYGMPVDLLRSINNISFTTDSLF